METLKILVTFSIESDNDILDPIYDMLDVVPEEATSKFFLMHNMRFLRDKNKNKILWLVKYKKNVQQCCSNIFEDITLRFNIYYRDVKIFNLFNIKNNVIYCFKNGYKGNLLHKNDFVIEDDSVPSTEYNHKLLGVVDLNMDKISKDVTNNEYIIKFKHQ